MGVRTGTRMSLEALRRRLQHSSHFSTSRAAAGDSDAAGSHQAALLTVDVELAIPHTVTQPSLDEAQAAVGRAVQTILATTEHVTPWKHFNRQQLHLQKVRQQLLTLCGRLHKPQCQCQSNIYIAPIIEGRI